MKKLYFAIITFSIVGSTLLVWGNIKELQTDSDGPYAAQGEDLRSDIFSYQGQGGKTALALLQASADVKISGEGEMAFVTSINGRRADEGAREYWSFWVNGEMAQVGAGSYMTKDGDLIEWKIATY